MNNLMNFEGHRVEIFEFNGQVLFNPYNVGECLGIKESAIRMALSKMNEKQVIKLTNLDVNNIDIRKLNNAGENFLTESGVYKLVFKSRKPEAERFQDWVTDEVLPSIRKNGMYAEDELLDNPDLLIKIILKLKQERENRKQIEKEKQALQIELDSSKEWYSIKRVAALNGVSWKTFDWKKLKAKSLELGLGIRKIFDANYTEVNTYHSSVWEAVYPDYEL